MQQCTQTFGGCVEERHIPGNYYLLFNFILTATLLCLTLAVKLTRNLFFITTSECTSEIHLTAIQKECAILPHVHPTSRYVTACEKFYQAIPCISTAWDKRPAYESPCTIVSRSYALPYTLSLKHGRSFHSSV